MLNETRVKRSKRSAITICAIGMFIVTALFIADWIRLGTAEGSAMPETTLFVGWLLFIFPTAIQLVLYIPDWPLGSLILDGVKTAGVCIYYVIMLAITGHNGGIEITGIVTLFEAYGDRIMQFASMYSTVFFFGLDIIVCTVWMVQRRINEGRACSRAGRVWLASGVLTLALWGVMAFLYYMDTGGVGAFGFVPAVIYLALGIAWWFASKRSRAGSVILFVLLTICAIVSSSTTYFICTYVEPAELVFPILELAGVVIWYVSMCILLARRWRAVALAPA